MMKVKQNKREWRMPWAWLLSGLLCLAHTGAGAEVITYPRPESPADHRGDYPVALLRLALSEAGSRDELRAAQEVMTQDRALVELKRNRHLRVMWTMTTVRREAEALPIRIPIYKGLIGWRLPLVHAGRSAVLSGVRELRQLSSLTAGQGHDWPDTDILRANGLKVATSSSYTSLFQMLGAGRFDYMPRSISEIWDEVEAHRADGIMVDQSIVLHYPAAVYFFVNKQDVELARRIERGLERAIANGKFDRLFYAHHAALIERARLAQRRVIELNNPMLPAETPLHRKELWVSFPSAIRSAPSP